MDQEDVSQNTNPCEGSEPQGGAVVGWRWAPRVSDRVPVGPTDLPNWFNFSRQLFRRFFALPKLLAALEVSLGRKFNRLRKRRPSVSQFL